MLADHRHRVLPQVSGAHHPGWVTVDHGGAAQLPIPLRQEADAEVGQPRDHQLGSLLRRPPIAVSRGGDQMAGLHEEVEALLGALRFGPGGALPGHQRGAFPLGALPGGQVHHIGNPAERAAAGHRRAHQDRHPVPVGVHVLLLVRPEGTGAVQLPQRVGIAGRPFRRSQPLVGELASVEVRPAVPDDAQEGVVRVVHPVLADQHHPEHVGLAEPP